MLYSIHSHSHSLTKWWAAQIHWNMILLWLWKKYQSLVLDEQLIILFTQWKTVEEKGDEWQIDSSIWHWQSKDEWNNCFEYEKWWQSYRWCSSFNVLTQLFCTVLFFLNFAERKCDWGPVSTGSWFCAVTLYFPHKSYVVWHWRCSMSTLQKFTLVCSFFPGHFQSKISQHLGLAKVIDVASLSLTNRKKGAGPMLSALPTKAEDKLVLPANDNLSTI